MSTRSELLDEKIEVRKFELDGKTYRFKPPTVDAKQRVLNVGGLTDLPGLNAPKKQKGQREAPRKMALGRMKIQALIETLLEGETDALVFTVADVDALMAVPIGSKSERLASWAWETLFADPEDETDEEGAPVNP